MTVNLQRPPRSDNPTTEVPDETFLTCGFGLIQVSNRDWDRRIIATRGINRLLKAKQLPADDEGLQVALSIVRDMFFRVHVGRRYDWFTTSKFLGHPSGDLCKTLATQFSIMKGAIREQSHRHFASAVAVFEENHGFEMLDNYLDMTVNAAHPVKEEGWAYILWSSSEKDVLHIGAAGGEIDEVTTALDAENPEFHPYGVLAAWLVHDPVDAFNVIKETFDGEALGGGFYRVDMGTARRKLDAVLKRDDNFALSPWHDYEPELEAENAPPALAVGM